MNLLEIEVLTAILSRIARIRGATQPRVTPQLYGDPQEVEGVMSNRSTAVHGHLGVSKLPIMAPAIANENDELIFTIRNEDGIVIQAGILDSLPESYIPTRWDPEEEYQTSSTVFLQKDGTIWVSEIDPLAAAAGENREQSTLWRGRSETWQREDQVKGMITMIEEDTSGTLWVAGLWGLWKKSGRLRM